MAFAIVNIWTNYKKTLKWYFWLITSLKSASYMKDMNPSLGTSHASTSKTTPVLLCTTSVTSISFINVYFGWQINAGLILVNISVKVPIITTLIGFHKNLSSVTRSSLALGNVYRMWKFSGCLENWKLNWRVEKLKIRNAYCLM